MIVDSPVASTWYELGQRVRTGMPAIVQALLSGGRMSAIQHVTTSMRRHGNRQDVDTPEPTQPWCAMHAWIVVQGLLHGSSIRGGAGGVVQQAQRLARRVQVGDGVQVVAQLRHGRHMRTVP